MGRIYKILFGGGLGFIIITNLNKTYFNNFNQNVFVPFKKEYNSDKRSLKYLTWLTYHGF